MAEHVLKAEHISKKYGYRKILNDIQLDISAGEKVWIKGANGVGKTTLLKILAGMLRPTEGQIFYAAKDVWEDIQGYRKNVGVLFEESYLFPEETLLNNLYLYAELMDVPTPDVARWVSFFSLAHIVDRPVKHFSKGERQKASLIRAILKNPKLCVFDEPLSGLDSRAQSQMTEYLSQSTDRTYIFSAHEDFSNYPWITQTIDLSKVHP